MDLTISTLAPGAKAVAGDTAFEVRYENDPRVTLRLPDYTAFSADVGLTDPDEDSGRRRGMPGRFHLDDSGASRVPYLLDGKEIWGQSLRRPRREGHAGELLLALWTSEPTADAWTDGDDACGRGLAMPHRRAVLNVRDTWVDGGDDDTAAFLAGLATGVAIRWATGLSWPPCINTDKDMDGVCPCGEEHWAPRFAD